MKPPEQNSPPIVLIKPIKHIINNRQQSNQNINNKGDIKEPKKIEFKEIPKSFFSYRHISLRDYLTSDMARGKIINNKNNYLKAFSLFKQFKPESLQVNSNTLTLPTRTRVYRNSFPNQNIPNVNKNNNASSVNKTTVKTKEQNGAQQHNQQLIPPLQQTKKKFICIGGYADVIENLVARGWEQNKDPKSSDFDFIWTLKTIDINYTNLRKEQIAGHFLRRRGSLLQTFYAPASFSCKKTASHGGRIVKEQFILQQINEHPAFGCSCAYAGIQTQCTGTVRIIAPS